MRDDFFIVMDKDQLDMALLRTADESLPRVIRYMNTCTPFVGLVQGKPVANALVEKKPDCWDIVILAVAEEYQGKGYGRELLAYVMDYVRSQGVRYVEIGCGNADIRLQAMFQKAGFRFYAILHDYLLEDNKAAVVVSGILNRDRIRFRADLHEKKLTTIGYDASGRK
jgi:ribosomal protein S18 acetylase RimI-like enzyme